MKRSERQIDGDGEESSGKEKITRECQEERNFHSSILQNFFNVDVDIWWMKERVSQKKFLLLNIM